ncbi:MAG: hypothetical protein JW952_08135 [Candidatus Eisenbacteria bacterium]|nr:hypothetical protein [Candidatus Eisenbacteria bacterium]
MKRAYVWLTVALLAAFAFSLVPKGLGAKEVVRPEDIKSLRQVVYDEETYEKLAKLWENYFDEYPSEYAYANWMYAARYAHDKDYSRLLSKGVRRYPANPTLLYLKGLERLGATDDAEGLEYLERAAALDSKFPDPWFPLVTHRMRARDEERVEAALRRLAESGAITDEVMDFNYNLLVGLDKDAILVTNGDNDTYPGWILTRVLKVRPDVSIVNRSLLNTEWYPLYVIERGVPRFTDKTGLAALRSSLFKAAKDGKGREKPGGLFGDALILKLVESAGRAGRPVYLSKTLFASKELEPVVRSGRELGLVTLVTPSRDSYAEQLRRAYQAWLDDFRTAGLDSWRLKSSPKADAGRMLMSNYAWGIAVNLEALKKDAPDLRLKLFRWYIEHVQGLLQDEMRHKIGEAWSCGASDVKEIDAWLRQQGLECRKQ